MRKKATEKAEKVTEAATPTEGLAATAPARPAASTKVPSTARKRPAAKPAQAAELPRLSLAALAMGTTATQVAEKPAVAKTSKAKTVTAPKADKPAAITKVAKVAKAGTTSKATKTVRPAKAVVADAPEVTDAKAVAATAETKRKIKGIRLAPSLNAPTEAIPVATMTAPATAPEPSVTPNVPPPAMPEAVEEIRLATPTTITPKASFLASAWSALRHPPRLFVTTLSVLFLALAGFAFVQETSSSDDAVSATVAAQPPAAVGPYGEPSPYGQNPYHPVAYRPYGEPSYRSHYDYRQAPYGRTGGDFSR